MANSFTEVQVTGVTSYTFSIPYISQAHIKVYVGGILQTLNTHYTFTGDYTIEFTAGNVPADTTKFIRVQRDTSTTERLVSFSNTALDASDLNRDSDQVFYMVQEAVDTADGSMTKDAESNFFAEFKRITGVADPVGAQDVSTRNYVDAYVSDQIAGLANSYHIAATAPSNPVANDLWINTTDNTVNVYTGAAWVNGGVKEARRYDFLGSSSSQTIGSRVLFPTSLYGDDAVSIIQVYLNGVLLKPTTTALDFTTGDYDILNIAGLSISPAPVADDEITVVTAATISSTQYAELQSIKDDIDLVTAVAYGGRSVTETFTATTSQTVFTLNTSYIQYVNNVSVYVNGLRTTDFTDTSTSSITLDSPATVGDKVIVVVNDHSVSTSVVDASNVSYVNGSVTSAKDALDDLYVTTASLGSAVSPDLLMNSQFNVWQRGLTITDKIKICDRWDLRDYSAAGGSVTAARETTDNETDQANKYCLKITPSGNTGYQTLTTRLAIEQPLDYWSTEYFTMTFEVDFAYDVDVQLKFQLHKDLTNTTLDIYTGSHQTVSAGKRTISFTGLMSDLSTHAADIGANAHIAAQIRTNAALADGDYRFYRSKLEKGSTFTGWSKPNDFGAELLRCQRYYQTNYPYGYAVGSYSAHPNGYGGTVTSPIQNALIMGVEYGATLRTRDDYALSVHTANSAAIAGKFTNVNTAANLTAHYRAKTDKSFSIGNLTGNTVSSQQKYTFFWVADAEYI